MLEALGWVWKRLTGVKGGPVKVIVVDDSAFIRLVVSRKLDQFPYVNVVGTAADIEEATEVLTEQRPDVIVLDLEMPGGNGLELLEDLSLRERKRCILLTAMPPGHPYVERGLKLGAAACVHKASDPIHLPKTLQELGEHILRMAGVDDQPAVPATPTLKPLRLAPG
jgi:DNA-binding NarL/FixJ family response regulator